MRLPAGIIERLRPAYAGRPVCVTGGAGFIGGHLLDALQFLGASITVIDDLSNSTPHHVAELVDMDPASVRFIHASILDDEALDDAIRGPMIPGSRLRAASDRPPPIVFHLAAIGSVPRSIAEPQRTWAVNADGTMRVLECARRAGVRRIVYAASSSAYGGSETTPIAAPNSARSETMLPVPLSPYAASKLAGESAMTAWARAFDISTVSLRFFNVFGPRQPAGTPYAAAVAAFINAVVHGKPPVIYGDGRQARDFTFVANAVLACLLAGSTTRELRGESVNIGSGRSITLLQLYEAIANCAANPAVLPPPRHEAQRPGDPRFSLADLSLARSLLGYEPAVAFEEGIRETVAWHQAALSEAQP